MDKGINNILFEQKHWHAAGNDRTLAWQLDACARCRRSDQPLSTLTTYWKVCDRLQWCACVLVAPPHPALPLPRVLQCPLSLSLRVQQQVGLLLVAQLLLLQCREAGTAVA